MASKMNISDIYASQMDDQHRGYALWRPDGHANSSEIEFGDVGFFKDGTFMEMFKTQYPADKQPNPQARVPSAHNVFRLDDFMLDKFDEFLQPAVYSSKSVTHSKIGTQAIAEVPALARAKAAYTLSSTEEKGALLIIRHSAVKEEIRDADKVRNYVKQNFTNWYHHAKSLGWGLKDTDIVFLSGYIKTIDWTVAAFRAAANAQHASAEASGGIHVEAGIGLDWTRIKEMRGSLERRSGPKPKHRVGQDSGNPSSSTQTLGSTTAPYDQTIFLVYFKVKWRFVQLTRVMKAGAGPHELDPDRDAEDAHAAAVDNEADNMEVESNPARTEIKTSLDVLLDYILQKTDAKAAIACHDNIRTLLLGIEPPSNFAQFLEDLNPALHVDEDQIGSLDLVELVRKERIHEITGRATSAIRPGGPDMDVDDDDDDGDVSRSQRGQTGGLSYGKLLLGGRGAAALRWPHLSLHDKELDAGSVSSVALSPDGECIAAGFDDPVIRLWDAKRGQLLSMLEGHEEAVWCVAFSPDGKRIVSGSADTTVLLWDLTGESEILSPTHVLSGHSGDVSVVTYSPDGSLIASGSVDCTVKFWDTTTGECTRTLDGHTTNVMQIAFSPDGTRFVSCAEAEGKIWSVETGNETATMTGHEGAIWCLAVSKEGDRVLTGSEDHTCRIWDLSNGAELVTFAENDGPVWSVAWSPDDKQIVSGSYDARIVVSDSWTGERYHIFGDGTSIVDTVAWSPRGDLICSGSADGTVKVWDTKTNAALAEYQGHRDKVKSVIFTSDGRDVISSSDDGSIRRWSVLDAARLVS